MTNEDIPSEIEVSPIDAAHDYREQLQSRSVDNFDNPHGVLATLTQDNPLLRELLAESVEHLAAQHRGLSLEAAVNEILAQGQYDTKYDNSIFYKVLQPLAKEIEAVIAEQGLDLKGGVSAGVDYQSQAIASTSPTFGHSSSVVLITAGFFDFCHVIAHLLARTFPATVTEDGVTSVDHSPDAVANMLSNSQELHDAWHKVFVGEQLSLSDCFSAPLTSVQLPTYLNILISMEAFALAHEYGHHIASHSLQGVASVEGVDQTTSFAQEHEADSYGLNITTNMHIARSNLYCRYGLGPVIFFAIRDIAARGKSLLEKGKAVNDDTEHPPLSERIDAIAAGILKVLPQDERQLFHRLFVTVIQSLTLLQEIYLGLIQVEWQKRQYS